MKGVRLAFHFIWMAFSEKNPICNTVKTQNFNIDSVLTILQGAWWFPSLKTFKNLLYWIQSVGFSLFSWKMLLFQLFQVSTVHFFCCCCFCIDYSQCSQIIFVENHQLWAKISRKSRARKLKIAEKSQNF